MARGFQEKIRFIIRKDHAEYDRQQAENYITRISEAKENKKAEIFIKEILMSGDKEAVIEIAVLEAQSDKDKIQEKGFSKFK